MAKAKTKATVMFTGDELHVLQRAASAVWDEVAYDVLQAVAEDKGQNINRVTIPRSHVIEIALDADRMVERVRRMKLEEKFVTELLDRVSAADYPTLIRAVKPAFTYTRYGL